MNRAERRRLLTKLEQAELAETHRRFNELVAHVKKSPRADEALARSRDLIDRGIVRLEDFK